MDESGDQANQFLQRLWTAVTATLSVDIPDSYTKVEDFFEQIKKFEPSVSHQDFTTKRAKRGFDAIAFDSNPPEFPFLVELYKFRFLFGHTYLTLENLNDMIKFIKNDIVLEIGAGNGYVGYALQLAGIPVVLTDLPDDQNKYPTRSKIGKKPWTSIDYLDYQKALSKYNYADCLLLIWPPPYNQMAAQTIEMFQGNKIIYIVEPDNDDYTNRSVFVLLEKKWKLQSVIRLKHFVATNDSIYFYVRK
jgi:hypothetical protein